jgi:hypothetical protein
MRPARFSLIVKRAEPILATADAETQTAFDILLTTGGNMVSRSAAEALAFAYLVGASGGSCCGWCQSRRGFDFLVSRIDRIMTNQPGLAGPLCCEMPLYFCGKSL